MDERSTASVAKLDKKNSRLKSLLQKYKYLHQLQNALIQLSEQASTAADLRKFYQAIQELLATYLPSNNFYVVLKNSQSQRLELSYFSDQKDDESVPKVADVVFEHGVTGYVLRNRETAYFNKEAMLNAAHEGKFKIYGSLSAYWLGVPIFRDGDIIGVIVSQSYDEQGEYSAQQISLFETIALHLSTAIERVKKRELLEAQVQERTFALLQSNQALNEEIAQRKKALERQQTLFQIAELASQSININDVYFHVHQILRAVTYAENLYIALYDQDENWLSFPYAVDNYNQDFSPRPFAKGFSELVLTTKQCQLIDVKRAQQLIDSDQVTRHGESNGHTCTSWLGAPLKTAQGVFGLIVCQAYDHKYEFVQDDVELISYVSNQIANVLQNQLAQQALRQSYQELELRVAEKTRELRHANLNLKMQIEERRKIEQQLYYDAHHDALTGLPNRSLFLTQLERTLSHYKRFPEQDFAVLFIDLDGFKEINDKLGHQAGDQFLIEAAQGLKQCVREHDLVARVGGDEFVILLSQLNDKNQASEVAQRITGVMSKPYCTQGQCIRSGASIGITYSNSNYNNTDEVIRDADAAMYYAKQTGKGRVEFYHPLLHCDKETTTTIESHSLRELNFSFRVSDIVDYEATTPVARLFEAFAEHPVLGRTHFSQVKRFAKNKDEQIDAEFKLLEQALATTQQEQLLVNCSTVLLEEDFFERFNQLLNDSGKKRALCLVFNEAELRCATSKQVEHLRTLHAQEVCLGIDEVAKERCELSTITLVPFHCIVLNATFCRRVLHEPRYDHMLQALLAVAKLDSALVIAKGPSILNYRTLLENHGVHCFVGQHPNKSHIESNQGNSCADG